MKSCRNCGHKHETWELDERDGEHLMRCRRFPPQVTTTDEAVYSEFPTVTERDLCGEWIEEGGRS